MDTCAILQRPLEPAPTPSSGTDAGFASLATVAAEAPYKKSAELDFSKRANLLAAKRDDAADYLWSLREDPSYFEAHMLEGTEHSRQVWSQVLADQITCAYCEFEARARAGSLQDFVLLAICHVYPGRSRTERLPVRHAIRRIRS